MGQFLSMIWVMQTTFLHSLEDLFLVTLINLIDCSAISDRLLALINLIDCSAISERSLAII